MIKIESASPHARNNRNNKYQLTGAVFIGVNDLVGKLRQNFKSKSRTPSFEVCVGSGEVELSL